MNPYILILLFSITPISVSDENSAMSTQQVPGFATEQACISAGEKATNELKEIYVVRSGMVRLTLTTNSSYSCIKQLWHSSSRQYG